MSKPFRLPLPSKLFHVSHTIKLLGTPICLAIAIVGLVISTFPNGNLVEALVFDSPSGHTDSSPFSSTGSKGTFSNHSCGSPRGQRSHEVGNATPPAWPWQIYKTASFTPPILDINTTGQPLGPGFLFLTPSDASSRNIEREPAALIMTDTGELVWNGPIVAANNLRVSSYEGKNILTYWTGGTTSGANVGHGYGSVTFLDSSYKEILVVCPKLDLVFTDDDAPHQCEGDFHESFITERDTLLVTAYNVTEADLSLVGGPKSGWAYDCLFFELDPRTGKILFSWSALDHVSVADTKLPLLGAGQNKSVPFDWFHINSVVNIGAGYLVSSRHAWSTYLLTSSGDIIWTLQGETDGDFAPLPMNGRFAWQHFARPHNITNDSISISYFNNLNGGIGNVTHPSTFLELQLSLPPNNSSTPTVLRYLSDASDPLVSISQGSHLVLSNGNSFGGYGQIPVMREFGPNDPSGTDLRWSARFGPDNVVQSYRAFKQVWHGYPTTVPNLVVEFDENACGTAYVSWNGATDVSAWAVFEGPDEDHLSGTGQVGHLGFETKFGVEGPCVQVAATVKGKVTRSDAICRGV